MNKHVFFRHVYSFWDFYFLLLEFLTVRSRDIQEIRAEGKKSSQPELNWGCSDYMFTGSQRCCILGKVMTYFICLCLLGRSDQNGEPLLLRNEKEVVKVAAFQVRSEGFCIFN